MHRFALALDSMACADEKTVAEHEHWKQAGDEIIAAAHGDPVAAAESFKEVERLRRKEENDE